MKRIFILSTLFFGLLAGFGTVAKAQTPETVFNAAASAFQKKDAVALQGIFNSTVELSLPGADGPYAAQQGAMVMKEFFTQYQPTSFKIVHTGNSGGTSYATGTLVTTKGTFDTNIFVKKVGDKFLITSIRMEAE